VQLDLQAVDLDLDHLGGGDGEVHLREDEEGAD
jgi:hypothetical protein